ncbi:BQ2448_301 [Microbotryum intermedium]|uniref:BQ2448_301 protein n=1 Tax=Microbotryum intermedium TaxID=269621 RepID=A0A238F225_9BASI|nr:BQ2448_301 [Microbotryum intermedium]
MTTPNRLGTTAATATATVSTFTAHRASLPQGWMDPSNNADLSKGKGKTKAMTEPATGGGTTTAPTPKSSYQAEEGGHDPLLETLLHCVTATSDSESNEAMAPLLVLAACYLPPATSPRHETILDALKHRLELYARNGSYSVVLLASPVPNPPPTTRIISLFLSLSRETRKNVVKVWVVGGGWSLRALLALFTSRLLSGKAKARRKMVHCSTLGALAREVGSETFLSIEFPPEVYAANARHGSQDNLAASQNRTSSKQFGVPLSEMMGPEGEREPPSCMVDCLAVLRKQGPESTGIFRKSPRATMVTILQAAYDRGTKLSPLHSHPLGLIFTPFLSLGHTLTLSTYPDAPHLAASLLKLYLRSLPTPIFPLSMQSTITSCPIPRSAAETYVRTTLLPSLPAPERSLLRELVEVLRAIETKNAHNKMDAYNLVVCLTPTLWTGLRTGSGTEIKGAPAASTAEEIKSMLEMCKVPDPNGGAEGNTVAGVLKVMIEA